MLYMPQLVSIKEASKVASNLVNREVSSSSISYLIQYGKIRKFNNNGSTLIDVDDLKNYYFSYNGYREITWKKKLGDDLNWALSFDNLREKDTTKHVHRLHPYKGKFIPQLVQYFLDNHIDQFKTNSYFKRGDVILDPFSGSGTTVVQANELAMHGIGIDVSRFNSLIAEVKLLSYDIESLEKDIKTIVNRISQFELDKRIRLFEEELTQQLYNFNNKFFQGSDFRFNLARGKFTEKYCKDKERDFLKTYNSLLKKYNIQLRNKTDKSFLDKWYAANIGKEIDYAFDLIKTIKDKNNRKLLAVILSRTIRSCRATTHSDLATLKYPQLTTYYCFKHKKMCKPISTIKNMFVRYAYDSLDRIKTFKNLKTDSFASILTDDSKTANIFERVKLSNLKFYKFLKNKRIKGIFTSPPYVGQIDYHEQHAYAYDLFGFTRKDELEIGPLYRGQGIEARKSYIEGISKVLLNCKNFLAKDYDVFIVANDKYNLYPEIANNSGMKIVNLYKRPVLNRTERDKSPYSEIIFHLKEK